MTSKIDEVRALIESAAGAAAVFHAFPANWAVTPCVAYRETENRVFRRADGAEALTELIYTVDVWSGNCAEARALLAAIDRALSGAGYARTQAQTLFEERTRYFHACARFRALTDGVGLYQ